MKNLLIVANCPSENTHKLARSVANGANDPAIENVSVSLRQPLNTSATEVLACDGIIIGSTENFGYLSGLMKDFFERIYYPCLEETQGLPYALYIRAGNDGSGAMHAAERIITGLRWSPIQPPLIMKGDYLPDFEESCSELGMLMAAGLDAGVF